MIGSLGLTYAFAAWSIGRDSGIGTTYPGHSIVAAWSFVTAGLALIAAGLVTVRRRSHVGVLAVLAGFLWFAPIWEGWQGGPAIVRTIGMLAASFVFPAIAHLVLAATGTPMSRAAVWLVGATYVLVGLCAAVVVLVRDPYLDPYCWANCTTNVFDVTSQPELARQISRLQLGITAASALVLIMMCAARLVRSSTTGVRRNWKALPGGVLFGVATVSYYVLRRQHPLEDPSHAGYATVFILRCASVVLIAIGLAAVLLDTTRRRRSVARIVATLDEAPPVGGLDSALARALGDTSLRICYWLPAAGRYVDADGREVPDPSTDTSVTATPLVRNGQTVAVVSHHSDPVELEQRLGSAIRLALDNERLQADMYVRMHDLADSRARIVEAGDVRRRRLERDLHDGAQQSLLGLALDLRLARSTATASGDAALTALLDSAIGEVSEAFGELRDLAHGIFPAALIAAGLCPAVSSLAGSCTLRVDVHCMLGERLTLSIEAAGYAVVAGALEVAGRGSAHQASVAISRRRDALLVEVTHDGEPGAADLVHVADRVGAVGGRLEIAPNRITAEIPCAS